MSILEFFDPTTREEEASSELSLADMPHSRIVNDQSICRHVSSAVPSSALRVKWRELPASSSADVVISRATRDFLASVMHNRSTKPHHDNVGLCINERPCLTRRCSRTVTEERHLECGVGCRSRGWMLEHRGARAEARKGFACSAGLPGRNAL